MAKVLANNRRARRFPQAIRLLVHRGAQTTLSFVNSGKRNVQINALSCWLSGAKSNESNAELGILLVIRRTSPQAVPRRVAAS